MGLEKLYHSLDADKKILQFGAECSNPLTEAFPAKRVMHAGINGTIISPEQAQSKWRELMSNTSKYAGVQTAYIHIPFCKTKCSYCGFYQNALNQQMEDEYIENLIAEIQATAQYPRFANSLIHAVFIGGGTPTSLSKENAAKLLSTIQEYFPLSNDYELTLEGRIHDVTVENLETWFQYGVNRLSLGVQSFNTTVRRQVGRLDSKEEVIAKIKLAQSYQQAAVIIDLMYGLPGQTQEIWLEDLATMHEIGVDGADLYQLNIIKGTNLDKQIKNGVVDAASTTSEQAVMFALAHDYLTKLGYKRLSMCHWSRHNRERSWYNSLARAGVPMFPFGCGAGGNVDGYSTMLHRVLQPYNMFVQMGKKPFMALMKQPDCQYIVNVAVEQIEQGYLDIHKLISLDERLASLQWLCDLWSKRELLEYNSLVYKLTIAGEFWYVNISQTVIECIQYLLTGEDSMSVEQVAEQSHSKMHEMMKKMQSLTNEDGVQEGNNFAAMKKMAEMMGNIPADKMQKMMEAMHKMK